ncbi:helix-hairpin-helix domain-containing protein [Cupriavidus oxalaticus]|uniref:Helix-hairpin-helix domain-containing protein n=1 Tax=Cupriavidus oxalaticus TaxID=96344 RepID=A0A4P7LJ50_9BURK|nr:helix-hairpin-helix domain-containing protein [Cupriavidus oxalaticus]QBY56176.1 helix-hairpin-helix domain-containing protein [Cupriavidus oxalaticus]
MELFDSNGRRIALGRVLGRGGEGTVHEVPSISQHLVAKVYHEPIAPEKQAKLRAMVGRVDERLKEIATWPLATLHPSASGPVRGFLMPKAAQADPVHHLYGPAHRKQRFPNADWSFLVNTARNIASAFKTVHTYQCVIGDVNPNLVFVSKNSIVRLIDCDSFQVPNGNSTFFCEVGVPHFTPPELQGLSSFRGIHRTENHDNFGLALLVFHLLLMGRHPFSGRYSGRGDMSLEKAIAEFRFAFGLSASSKGMSAPPNAVIPAILPPAMAAMFELAFTEKGAGPNGRPTAANWVSALDSLKAQLRTCRQEAAHKYFGALANCPWCAAERQSGISFFIGIGVASTMSTSSGAGAFNIVTVWANIRAVQSPGSVSPPVMPSSHAIKANPLPSGLRAARTWRRVRRWGAVLLLLVCIVTAPKYFFGALLVAALLYFLGNSDSQEMQGLKAAWDTAKQVHATAQEQWKAVSTDQEFQAKLNELHNARKEYDALASRMAADKQKLQSNVRDLQLRKYLDTFFIADHDIPGIGPTRKAILTSFGVESAADISWNRVKAIRGFGDRLTRDLLNWRRSLEAKFVFNPNQGLDPADIATLHKRYTLLKSQLETQMQAGPSQLAQIRNHIQQRRAMLHDIVVAAALQVAQAEADFKAAA